MFMYVVTAEDGTTGTAVGNKDHENTRTKTILIAPVVMDKDRLMPFFFYENVRSVDSVLDPNDL